MTRGQAANKSTRIQSTRPREAYAQSANWHSPVFSEGLGQIVVDWTAVVGLVPLRLDSREKGVILSISRKDALISFGALAATVTLGGCGVAGIASPGTVAGNRGIKALPGTIRHGKAAFPLWKTDLNLNSASNARRASSFTIPPGGGDGSPGDPPGPSGSAPTRVYKNPAGSIAYSYRDDNVSSLYDAAGDLALQTQSTLNPNNTVTVQCSGPAGSSISYTLPPFDSIPINSWCSLFGSTYYLDRVTRTATMHGADGVTYLFSRDAASNIIVHSDDGSPDITLPISMLVGEAVYRRIHTAGLACNAASFALGFFGAAVIVSAVIAIVDTGGKGSGKIAAGATALVSAMYSGANNVCSHTAW